jgi:HlyD family secretion protein
VGDVTRLEVVTDLLSREAARVRPGNAVIVEGWGGAPLHGRVSRVEPSGFTKVSALGIEEQRVNVIVDLDQLPSGTPLGDGYRVDVQIVVAERESVLMLPIGAIFRDNQDWAVFAARDGRAVKTDIQVGQRSGTHVEIVGGLAEGDRAILYPSDSISDGTRIVARGAPAAR